MEKGILILLYNHLFSNKRDKKFYVCLYPNLSANDQRTFTEVPLGFNQLIDESYSKG